MSKKERKAIYDEWLQKVDENYRRENNKEPEPQEHAHPGIDKFDESSALMTLYAHSIERDVVPPPKKIAQIIKDRHPDIKAPDILIDFLCDIVLGKKGKGGRPRDFLTDFDTSRRNDKIFKDYQQMRADGIKVTDCYLKLAELHNLSRDRCKNIVIDYNKREKFLKEKYHL